MPLSQDDTSAIQAWAKEEGCAIGGIHGQDGDMSAELAAALCGDENVPSILYVLTTQLEAELLGEQILETFPDGRDDIGVWMGEEKAPYVAFTTYSTLRDYLVRYNGKEQPLFTAPAVVVFEHEMGMSVEGLITRDMLAKVASLLAEDQDGPQVKILGLSYSSGPQEWLQHPCRLLGGSHGHAAMSLDIRVKAEPHASPGSFKSMTCGEEGFRTCAVDIARTVKKGQNVVVFSARASFGNLRDAVQDVYPWDLKSMKEVFWEWPQVQLTRETRPVFTSEEGPGYMISMPHDRYPCALPFERVGMVLMMPPGPRRVYDEMARVCLRTEISLTEAQFRIESGLRSPGQAAPSVVCFLADSESLPRCPGHFINREDDPLAGWLSAVSSFPGCPVDQLPFYGALGSPTHSRDCLAQLQVMGLVTVGRDAVGYELTQKGQRVMDADGWLKEISLSGLSALADVLMSLGGNLARSAVRLILLLEYYPAMVEPIAGHGDIVSGGQFRSVLQDMASSSTHGGPGRRHVDRGSLWAAWVVFEEAAFGVDMSLVNFGEIFTHAEILPKTSTPPFLLRRKAVRDFVEDLAVWEQLVGLPPLRGNDWTGFRLNDHGADRIQEIMARSYYPYLMDVPVRAGAVRTLEHPGHSLYRSKTAARGTDPMYNLYKCMWAENIGDAAQSAYLYAGLSSRALGMADIGREITANIVMIMPHATAVGVDEDEVDRWARRNAGL
ncbi:hypothetical protein SLS64_013247 [Diaporthe eres]|uniref:Uncharacterized protein n=1 Tax=Diaporthe eres TaxID=83184 RepID=A0ABR1P1A0_DIAER